MRVLLFDNSSAVVGSGLFQTEKSKKVFLIGFNGRNHTMKTMCELNEGRGQLRSSPDGPAGFGEAGFGELRIASVAGAAAKEFVETTGDPLSVQDVTARFHDLADHVTDHLFDALLLDDGAEVADHLVADCFHGWFAEFCGDFHR